MNKINHRFDRSLDIRSFVRMHTNLSLLLRLLLDKKQMLLYRHNKRHSVGVKDADEKDSSSE